jgi:hypothetical protein
VPAADIAGCNPNFHCAHSNNSGHRFQFFNLPMGEVAGKPLWAVPLSTLWLT